MSLPDPSILEDPDFKESDRENLAQRGAHVTRILKNFCNGDDGKENT